MTAPAIVQLTPEQELYRAEKARRSERVRPEMAAAAAELERIEQLARENGKGGRPKGTGMTLGKNARPRGRAREPEPDAPGRPEWLTPPIPPRDAPAVVRHDTPAPTMAKTFAPRHCMLSSCGSLFTPTGSTHRFCSVEHRDEYNGTPKKAKAEKPEKKRKPVNTGFRGEPPRSTRAAKSSSPAIDDVQEQIDALDARREKLVAILHQLRELAEA